MNILKLNHLSKEKSPYLLQHTSNPVDWYPWGEEAFSKAKAEGKPIFLSIGYSSCHWCHVMKRESFEDEETAKILNKNFVSIKLDREERPDIDEIYMKSVISLSGQGGWPLSVFLTTDLQPFFGGTYYPKEDRYGLPSFKNLLTKIIFLWKTKKDEVETSAKTAVSSLIEEFRQYEGELTDLPLDSAYASLNMQFDSLYGGFNRSPKFPTPSLLFFLLKYYSRTKKIKSLDMVTKTLTHMATGGIYDQLAGGFHRYSVDQYWKIPHFEKMLYDNALLPIVYLEAYQATKNSYFTKIAKQTLDWAIREMKSPQGGFYTSQDAESEGKEGTYYAWTKDEITKILNKKDTEIFSKHYGITEEGNFEKRKNILIMTKKPQQIAPELRISEDEVKKSLYRSKKILFKHRNNRIKPATDDKILTSWNGMMISALAKGYQILEDDQYLQAAEKSADFILNNLMNGKELLRRWREGEAAVDGLLEDYAFMVMGLIDLYESNFDISRLEMALKLNQVMIERFIDKDKGGFYTTKIGRTDIITRVKDAYDGATLSANGVAATNLAKISEFTSDEKMRSLANKTVLAFWDGLDSNPERYSQMLCTLDFLIGKPKEIVLAGKTSDFNEMLKELRQTFIPNKIVAHSSIDQNRQTKIIPMLEGKLPINNKATVYVCQNYSCKQPVNDVLSLKNLLK